MVSLGMLTEAMVMLRKLGRQGDVARRAGVAQGTISKWSAGVKPTYDNRVIARDKLGIPLDAWDRPAPSPESAAA